LSNNFLASNQSQQLQQLRDEAIARCDLRPVPHGAIHLKTLAKLINLFLFRLLNEAELRKVREREENEMRDALFAQKLLEREEKELAGQRRKEQAPHPSPMAKFADLIFITKYIFIYLSRSDYWCLTSLLDRDCRRTGA